MIQILSSKCGVVTKMAWGKAGSTTLSSSGDNIDVTGFADNKVIIYLNHNIPTGSMTDLLRIDGNSGSNYAFRYNNNGVSESTAVNQDFASYLGWTTNTNQSFNIGYIVNISTEEKIGINHSTDNHDGTGAGTAPNRRESVFKLADTTNSVDEINIVNTYTGSFDTDSNLTVLGSDLTPAAAVPALGANLQVGSRFEETDTRKMYNLAGPDTPTFEDDFSGADNWSKSPSDSQFAVDTTNDRLEFLDDINSTGDRTWYDLGTDVSTTQWILRFKFRFTTLSNGSIQYYEFDAGLSDTTVDNNTNQNFIGVRVLPNDDIDLWRPRVCDGSSSPRTGSTANLTQVFAINTDYFVEIKRTSASNWAISLSTTNAYDGDLQNNSYTDASGATGLRYLKIGDAVTNSGTGFSMEGYVDDVEFYNGITSISKSNTWQEIGA